MEAHTHDSCEIMYVTAGSCTVRCGGEQFRMKPNQFVFVGASTPHCLEIRPEEPCSILNLEFAFRTAKARWTSRSCPGEAVILRSSAGTCRPASSARICAALGTR